MRTTLTKTRPDRAPNRDDQAAIAAAIVRATAGYDRPLRVTWERLDTDEQHALIELTRKADQPDGFGIGRLTARDRARWERLTEKGTDQPGFFTKAREADMLRAEFAELRREVQSPPRRVKLEEPGSVTLPRQIVYDFVRDGILWPAHIAALVYLESTFENGGLPFASNAVSFDGTTITIDGRRGHLLPDPNGNFLDEEKLLDHLATNDFIRLEKLGRKWSIRPGSRLRAARAAA